ncbi:MAG: putative RDD family membrane protein YckC [Parvicella sp.]|jgi:uncharacterized RDD family membrane protein YckC
MRLIEGLEIEEKKLIKPNPFLDEHPESPIFVLYNIKNLMITETLDEIETITKNEPLPGFFERMKALVTDSIVIVILMLIIGNIFSMFESVSDTSRMIAFIFVFLLYDPIFTSLFGGTIGHLMNGIRVRRDTELDQKIIFPAALLRYIIKALLGWISFLTIQRDPKGKAIHDMAVNSMVVYRKK